VRDLSTGRIGSTVVIDAFALIMTSRVASEVNQANSTATQAAADAVINSLNESEKRRCGCNPSEYSSGSGSPSGSLRKSGTESP
jgi:hypothetical protein